MVFCTYRVPRHNELCPVSSRGSMHGLAGSPSWPNGRMLFRQRARDRRTRLARGSTACASLGSRHKREHVRCRVRGGSDRRVSRPRPDSVDMLGDAFVYVPSLFALDRSERWRAGDGSCQRLHDPRLWWYRGPRRDWGEDRRAVPPASVWMFVFGGLALVANLSCLRLLWRVRTIDINMSSTFECSRNLPIRLEQVGLR